MIAMQVTLQPEFLVQWVQAELELAGEPGLLAARAAQAQAAADGELDDDEAQLEAASALAERRGLVAAIEAAAASLGAVELREARGAAERIERPAPQLFRGPSPCTAWLKPAAGAAERLALLAERLHSDPDALSAELPPTLGGTPGCAIR